MPRARKHHPTIPAHIQQDKLPRGIYWDASGTGRWYVFEERDGKRGTKTIAGRRATLSELHAIAEHRAGGHQRGTINHVVERYKASPKFAKLSKRSRKDYAYNLDQACKYTTKVGPLGEQMVDKLSPPVFARLRDALAKDTPAKANAWIRRLSGAFAWGIQDGCCTTNPCAGVEAVEEAGANGMPSLELFRRVQAFARDRATLERNARGHVAPYLAPFMEIAYQSRLRSIEVLRLTDADITPEGLVCRRTKGSKTNVARIGPLLAASLADLKKRRKEIWEERQCEVHIRPELRFLFIGEGGEPLTRDGFSAAWQRMMRLARDPEHGVLREGERFTAHGLKHRGITDSADKTAGGHKSEQMRHRYDHSLPIVDPAADPIPAPVKQSI
jgi:integrase